MASEKQIAANRRNATKSTGPRSSAGKKRASRNAYRHGLSLPVTASATLGQELENRAREIVAESDGAITLEPARAVVEPELDRARMQRLKITLIEQMWAEGGVDAVPASSNSDAQVVRVLRACGRVLLTVQVPAPMTMEETEQWAKATLRAPHCRAATPSDSSTVQVAAWRRPALSRQSSRDAFADAGAAIGRVEETAVSTLE